MMEAARSENLKSGKQLNAMQVYRAAIAIFERPESGFALVGVVRHPVLSQMESARCYIKDGKHHLLYFPGRDNDIAMSLEKTTDNLSTLLYHVRDDENLLLLPVQRQEAEKHFFVCENNRYFGFEVEHFIYANLLENNLVTTDSMDRDYDESGIVSAIKSMHSQSRHKSVKRGYQALTDSWQCGYFVLMELYRKLAGLPAPAAFEITEEVVDFIDEFHKKGLISYKQQLPDQTSSYASIQRAIDDDFGDFTDIIKGEDADTAPMVLEKTAGIPKPITPPPKSTLDKNPLLKNVLWGAIIVLGLVLIAAIIITMITITSGVAALPLLAGLPPLIASLSTGAVAGFSLLIALLACVAGASLGAIKYALWDDNIMTPADILSDVFMDSETLPESALYAAAVLQSDERSQIQEDTYPAKDKPVLLDQSSDAEEDRQANLWFL